MEKANRRIPLLITGLFLSVARSISCNSGESLITGILLGWYPGVVVEISAQGRTAINSGNAWSICIPSVGVQTVRISSLSEFYAVTENSQEHAPPNVLTLVDASTDMGEFSFTLRDESARFLNSVALPAPESVDWTASPPGFDFVFPIQETTDRAYTSSLTSFGDCTTSIDGSGLSISGPQFLPDNGKLTDRVYVDLDQLASAVYEVNIADSTQATLQFCHCLNVYTRDPQTGDVSSESLHRSLTKVSATIRLVRPFTTPSAIQLSTESTGGGSVDVDGGLVAELRVYTCDPSKQEITLTTLTSGETIRMCIHSSPSPLSISEIFLTATPTTGGTAQVFPLVTNGSVERTVPGQVTLGDCNDDICIFDFSPRYSFFIDSPYTLDITGTILLRIGNRLRGRQTRKLEGKLAHFGMTFETVVSPSDTSERSTGMTTGGVLAIVVVFVNVILAIVAVYVRRQLRYSQKEQHQHGESNAEERISENIEVPDGEDENSCIHGSDASSDSGIVDIFKYPRILEDVEEFSDEEV